MTICVSVKVSEGLVLAADSASAVHGRVGQDHPGGILKTYDHVRKVTQIKDYPIGTLTWGTSLIGARSVQSLIEEYEHKLQSLRELEERMKEKRMRGEEGEPFEYRVKDIAQGLLNHVKEYYDAEFASLSKKPFLGMLVSGYSSGQFFPEQWEFELPMKSELKERRPDVEGKPNFGADWFGLTDAITRLHWGRDDRALQILSNRFNVPHQEISELLAPLQYPVLFAGMPLQDAIDYAVYLINVTIGRFRFVVGAPVCGGDIDVAVITPNKFSWVRQKSWEIR